MKYGNAIIFGVELLGKTDDQVIETFKNILILNARNTIGPDKEFSVKVTLCDRDAIAPPNVHPDSIYGSICWRSDLCWPHRLRT